MFHTNYFLSLKKNQSCIQFLWARNKIMPSNTIILHLGNTSLMNTLPNQKMIGEYWLCCSRKVNQCCPRKMVMLPRKGKKRHITPTTFRFPSNTTRLPNHSLSKLPKEDNLSPFPNGDIQEKDMAIK